MYSDPRSVTLTREGFWSPPPRVHGSGLLMKSSGQALSVLGTRPQDTHQTPLPGQEPSYNRMGVMTSLPIWSRWPPGQTR